MLSKNRSAGSEFSQLSAVHSLERKYNSLLEMATPCEKEPFVQTTEQLKACEISVPAPTDYATLTEG